jgi:two-component system sensor histidine kinase BarA
MGEISFVIDRNQNDYDLFCKYNRGEDELEILLNDISKLKLHEMQIKLKSTFLSKIAHEFKNPLVSLTELVNQSKEDLNKYVLPESIMKKSIFTCFNNMKALSDYLLILISDLNHFSESQMGIKSEYVKQSTKLSDVLEFCENITMCLLKKTNKQGNIIFKKFVDNSVPSVIQTNEAKLKQVIINLLSNAVKFTYRGRISIDIFCEGLRFIKILVKDSGTGMKEEQQQKIFAPFQKSHMNGNELGSGLGLSIVKEIVENLGGKIGFSSYANVGSQFWFTIPNDNEESNKEKPFLKSFIHEDLSSNLEDLSDDRNKTLQVDVINFDRKLITGDLILYTDEKCESKEYSIERIGNSLHHNNQNRVANSILVYLILYRLLNQSKILNYMKILKAHTITRRQN